MKRIKVYLVFVVLIFTGLLAGCATVSFDESKSYSEAITDTHDTALAKYAAHKTAHVDGQSGFYPYGKIGYIYSMWGKEYFFNWRPVLLDVFSPIISNC